MRTDHGGGSQGFVLSVLTDGTRGAFSAPAGSQAIQWTILLLVNCASPSGAVAFCLCSDTLRAIQCQMKRAL